MPEAAISTNESHACKSPMKRREISLIHQRAQQFLGQAACTQAARKCLEQADPLSREGSRCAHNMGTPNCGTTSWGGTASPHSFEFFLGEQAKGLKSDPSN